MNIPEILDKITNAILNLKFENILKDTKVLAVIFAAIAMAIILFGVLFSLIPQF